MTITQFLNWGYWGLFLSALITPGGILPIQFSGDEGGTRRHGPRLPCGVSSRRVGQHAGRHDLLWIGTLGKTEWITKLGVSNAPDQRAEVPSPDAQALLAFFAFLPHHRRSHRHHHWADAQQRVTADERRDARRQDRALHCRIGDFGRPIRYYDVKSAKRKHPRGNCCCWPTVEASVADYIGRGTCYAAMTTGGSSRTT